MSYEYNNSLLVPCKLIEATLLFLLYDLKRNMLTRNDQANVALNVPSFLYFYFALSLSFSFSLCCIALGGPRILTRKISFCGSNGLDFQSEERDSNAAETTESRYREWLKMLFVNRQTHTYTYSRVVDTGQLFCVCFCLGTPALMRREGKVVGRKMQMPKLDVFPGYRET